jgi:hypothetical protein
MSGLTCRSCGAEVIVAQTSNNKRMPVDRRASPKGNILLVHQPNNIPRAVVIKAEARERYAGKLRLSHFATCPNAAQHRQPKERRHHGDQKETSQTGQA